jgi:hypothetical protein
VGISHDGNDREGSQPQSENDYLVAVVDANYVIDSHTESIFGLKL